MTDLHKQYTIKDVQAFQAHFKQEKVELLDGCHHRLTAAMNLLEGGPVDENLVLIYFDIRTAIEAIEKYTKELLK